MITINDLDFHLGNTVLFQSASAQISTGSKVGLVGRNGCGKSTFFSLLTGDYIPDGGSISIPGDWQIATVKQETPALEISALDYVIEGDLKYQQLQRELESAVASNDGNRIAEIHTELEIIDAYTIKSRSSALLIGLGFTQEDLERPVKEFSGGWRMRLNLAQALIVKSDLLLLDEPTNHLDLDAEIFLESFLKSYRGTLVIISHDRDFLDHTVNKILNIENYRLTAYTANYTEYEIQKAEKITLQNAMYEKQQRAIAHMQSFVERFRYKATKAKQAQSRLKALERMEKIAAVHAESPFHFSFKTPDSLPNPLITMDNISLGYGEHVVIKKLRFNLVSGARIGLLGKNGAGKSTFIKFLAGELAPLSGDVTFSKGIKTGYFAQHQLERLRLNESALKHMQLLAPRTPEQELRNYLGGFAFAGDKVLENVSTFSGGEKARLALALIVWEKPNILLLDEPTNHLDLNMREALTMALQDYEGALVVVSHDRHLLKSTTDNFYLVDDGIVDEFNGDLEDYQKYLLEKQKQLIEQNNLKNQEKADLNKPKELSWKEKKQMEYNFKNEIRPLKQQIARLDQQITELTKKKAELEITLADNSIYNDENKSKLAELFTEQNDVTSKLEETEMLWLDLSEQLEQRQQDFEKIISGGKPC